MACMGSRKAAMTGKPDFKHISTSFVERQNLTMRMSMNMRKHPAWQSLGESVDFRNALRESAITDHG